MAPSLGALAQQQPRLGPSGTPAPSLGAMAQQHLSSKSPASAPSLAALAQAHQAGQRSSPGLSLGNLAKQHLSTKNPPGPPLPSLGALAQTTRGPSLGALAQSHLSSPSAPSLGQLAGNHMAASSSSTIVNQGFNIPNLFGTKPLTTSNAAPSLSALNAKKEPTKTIEPAKTIDLMQALRLAPDPTAKAEATPGENVNVNATRPDPCQAARHAIFDDLRRQQEQQGIISPSKQSRLSALGQVLCRERKATTFRRKMPSRITTTRTAEKDMKATVAFDFSTPSPDDVVLKAQSVVFRRPNN